MQDHEELPIFKSLEDKLERFLGLQKDIQSFNETEINLAAVKWTKETFRKQNESAAIKHRKNA